MRRVDILQVTYMLFQVEMYVIFYLQIILTRAVFEAKVAILKNMQN